MRIISLMMLLLLWSVVPSIGITIPSEVENDMQSMNFPTYPQSSYCIGTLDMGVRFASNDTPEKVRVWFQNKLPGWSVMNQFGTWVLYDGPADASPPEVMRTKQITVMKNENLPSWHGLAADMTTEIMMAFPNQ
ncbi:MAG: hypothetical protein RQ754_04485 [Desulfuromonadales bacterium]|nr:hypothetical protein [Desulfuromonadales bacterium]